MLKKLFVIVLMVVALLAIGFPTLAQDNGADICTIQDDDTGCPAGNFVYLSTEAGNDQNDGSLNSPVQTLARALELLGGQDGCIITLNAAGEETEYRLCQPDSGDNGAPLPPTALYALLGVIVVALVAGGRWLQTRGSRLAAV